MLWEGVTEGSADINDVSPSAETDGPTFNACSLDSLGQLSANILHCSSLAKNRPVTSQSQGIFSWPRVKLLK